MLCVPVSSETFYYIVYSHCQPRNAARLLSCVGHVLSSLPIDTVSLWLLRILPPITESLNSVLRDPMAAVQLSSKHTVLEKLNMLTWLFDSLTVSDDGSQPQTTTQQPVSVWYPTTSF